MAASLLHLMEELLQSIEQRDAGDPDAPAWEACARIQCLEEELASRLAAGESGSVGPAPADIQARRSGEALAGVVRGIWGYESEPAASQGDAVGAGLGTTSSNCKPPVGGRRIAVTLAPQTTGSRCPT